MAPELHRSVYPTLAFRACSSPSLADPLAVLNLKDMSPSETRDDGAPALPEGPAPEPGSWERLDQILQNLPPGHPTLSADDRDDFTKYQNPGPRVVTKEVAWQTCARAIGKYDARTCTGYREEIDTLLVFAGLFSAVVTAFTVESYQWLQDDPNDAIVGLLSQIARSTAANDTITAGTAQYEFGLPPAAAARINIYWFLALSLSLSAALVAILCKQWIREFERSEGFTPQEYVGVRQVKFEGFRGYGVGGIVASLPLLLQLSLAVFALGVIELIWRLHITVAIAASVPAFFAVSFYAATTFLPAIQVRQYASRSPEELSKLSQYPFKSPQAWLVIRAYLAFERAWVRMNTPVRSACFSILASWPWRFHFLLGLVSPSLSPRQLPSYHSWRDWDVDAQAKQYAPVYGARVYGASSYARGLAWLRKNQTQSDIQNAVWNCHWHEVLLVDRIQRHESEPSAVDIALAKSRLAFSHPETLAEHRVSTLRELLRATPPCTSNFLAEILVQNLPGLGPSDVQHFFGGIVLNELDTVSAVSLTTALASYGRIHIHEDMSYVLQRLSVLVWKFPDCPLRHELRGCVATLIVQWMRAGGNTDTSNLCRFIALSIPWERYRDRLHDLPYVRDIATMVRTFFEQHPLAPGLHVSWPPEPPLLFWAAHVTVEPELVLALLEISVCGVEQYADQRVAESTVPAPLHAPSFVSPSTRSFADPPALSQGSNLSIHSQDDVVRSSEPHGSSFGGANSTSRYVPSPTMPNPADPATPTDPSILSTLEGDRALPGSGP